jgi:hypothetical protein
MSGSEIFRSRKPDMVDSTKIVVIALGVALLVVVLVPALFMGVCLATGMTGGMMSGGSTGHMPAATHWVMGGFVVVVLALGVVLLWAGLRR